MRFLAELKGEPRLLADVASCFQSDHARIRNISSGWVLESSAFDACRTRDEVFKEAEKLLDRIHGVLWIYLGVHAGFSVPSVLWINSEGRAFKRSFSQRIVLRSYLPPAKSPLTSLRGKEALGSATVLLADDDKALDWLLSFVGSHEFDWPEVYNVIEFLGGGKRIADRGWASKERTDKVRRTANHYRHLGSPRKYVLPPNPPSLGHASNFVRGILERWIASRSQRDQSRRSGALRS